jgi:predicted LPLAT superfamily acyltransferase
MTGSAPSAAAEDWAAHNERGSRILVVIMVWIARHLGWHVGQALLYPITLWFYVTSANARAASREYLARALGRAPGSGDVMRHMFTFACVILDRVFFLSGRTRDFRLTVEGLETLTDILNSGRGCILFGSHLGSFDVLRAFGRAAPVRVSPVMFRANSRHLTTLLERLDPALARDVIELGRPDAMLRVQECIERGEMVGLLADRVPPRMRVGSRTVSAPFLGALAEFPTGPLALAAVLAAPVVLFYGLRRGPRQYVLRFEAFADRVVLPRAEREAALHRWVRAYASNLEQVCRAYPFNWFNFFPFWSGKQNG